MFRTLTVTFPAGDPATFDLTPTDGVSRVTLPSGSGKSAALDGLRRVLTGETGLPVEAATANRTYRVGTGKREVVTNADGSTAKYTAAADYLAALPVAFRQPDLTTLILSTTWGSDAYRAGIEGKRRLQTALLLALPPGSIPEIVREGMGKDWSDDLPCDIAGALALQKQANAAASSARGSRDTATANRDRAKTSPDLAAPVDTSADLALVESTDLWREYDQRAASFVTYRKQLAEWQKATPGAAPAYDEAAHREAEALVAKLVEEERVAREAQIAAEAAARASADAAEAARLATVAAEAKAAREAEEAKRAAEADARRREQEAAAKARAAMPAPTPASPVSAPQKPRGGATLPMFPARSGVCRECGQPLPLTATESL